MALHIIVDGYNFIRRSRELNVLDQQDMQLGREALADMLAAYKKAKGHRITVVFDGKDAPAGRERRFQTQGIQIIFSRTGRSADDVLKKMASKEKERALIVSSDSEVMVFCESQKSAVIRSEVFEDTIFQTVYASEIGSQKATASNERKSGTKKKGPRKRLSKQERRHRLRVGKL